MFIFLKPINLVLIASLFVLTAFLLAACGVATSTPVPTSTSQYLDTPTLINQAFDRGEISGEERLLYLAYAVFEYESLPARFHGNLEWFGEGVLEEIEQAANSPEVFCSMSPHIRSEFQRLLHPDTICN
jgi:hypothetical protein